VCANAGFVFHRNNEFMFLMLGETVLQIVVAIRPGGVIHPGDDPLFNLSVATAAIGFLIATCMMFSFRAMVRGQLEKYEMTNEGLACQASETEGLMDMVAATQGARGKAAFIPRNDSHGALHRQSSFSVQAITAKAHDVERGGAANCGASAGGGAAGASGGAQSPSAAAVTHTSLFKRLIDTRSLDVKFEQKAMKILLKMSLYNVLTTFLWQMKSLSIMLVGVGIKLAMFAPMASPHAHWAASQRFELGIPLAVCFSVQFFRSIFVANFHHYSLSTISLHPVHCLILVVRVALLVASALIGLQPIAPIYVMLELAFISVAQCVLMQLQDFRFPIRSMAYHPMAQMPNALLALQHRRRRYEYKEALPRRI
jgi:hypothetical protein